MILYTENLVTSPVTQPANPGFFRQPIAKISSCARIVSAERLPCGGGFMLEINTNLGATRIAGVFVLGPYSL